MRLLSKCSDEIERGELIHLDEVETTDFLFTNRFLGLFEGRDRDVAAIDLTNRDAVLVRGPPMPPADVQMWGPPPIFPA